MAEIGLGWFGWTEDQVLAMDVNVIQVAYAGRCDMLRTIFGGEEQPRQLPEMTAGMLSRRL